MNYGVLTLLLALAVSACNFMPGTPSGSAEVGNLGGGNNGSQRPGPGLGGNAEAYSGIIKRTYFDIVPNYRCRTANGDLIPSYRSRVTVDIDGTTYYGGDACSPTDARIPAEDVRVSTTKMVSSYYSNLYQYFETDPTSPTNTLSQAWCNTTGTNPQTYEFILGKKPDASYQIALFSVLNGSIQSTRTFSATYAGGLSPGGATQRRMDSATPSVAFTSVIIFNNITVSSRGLQGNGTMTLDGTTRNITCLFGNSATPPTN